MRSFTIFDIYRANAGIHSDHTALVEGETVFDYQTLYEKTCSMAALLVDMGVVKGDRVAFLGKNTSRFFFLAGACARIGAVLVPVNWRMSEEEMEYVVKDSGPKVLFHDRDYADQALKMKQRPWFSGVCENIAETEMPADKIDGLPRVSGDDPFVIIYTAAVAGTPMGALLSHENIIAGNLQLMLTLGLDKDDAFLNNLPLFHITGLTMSLSVMHAAGKNVVVEKFDAQEALRFVEEEKVSLMASFPPILSGLVEAAQASDRDLSALRHVVGIDAPDTITAFEKATGACFWVLYGQTETSGLATMAPYDEYPGTAGLPLPLVRIDLFDDHDSPVPAGEKGEIVVRGPMVFKGFWNQPDVNERIFRSGWHHTGDLGTFDDNGCLVFGGRKPEKELIKTGGENVYPVEVETAILSCPQVADACVIGVPDKKFGEGVRAVVALKPGMDLSGQDLIDHVGNTIARYKKPRSVVFVESLPKTAAGETDREQVKKEHGAG